MLAAAEKFCKAAERHGLTVNIGVGRQRHWCSSEDFEEHRAKDALKWRTLVTHVPGRELRDMGSMCTPSGAMGPEVSWRVERARAAYQAVAGSFFGAATFRNTFKKKVTETLLETRLLYKASGSRQTSRGSADELDPQGGEKTSWWKLQGD